MSAAERLGIVVGVELWRLRLDVADDEATLWDWLSDEERARAERLTLPHVRRRFVTARGGLRGLLAAHREVAPRDIAFHAGPHGKPTVEGGPFFSFSHSGELALCALAADRELGIDLEQLRPVPEARAIAERYFGPDGRAEYLREIRFGNDVFLRLWTRREAFLKAIGVGLSAAEAFPALDGTRWQVHDLEPGTGYVGALVVEKCAVGG